VIPAETLQFRRLAFGGSRRQDRLHVLDEAHLEHFMVVVSPEKQCPHHDSPYIGVRIKSKLYLFLFQWLF